MPISTADWLNPRTFVYDIIYSPPQTALLRAAETRGCHIINGIKMLVYQGARAFELWTGYWPPTQVMEEAVLVSLVQPLAK